MKDRPNKIKLKTKGTIDTIKEDIQKAIKEKIHRAKPNQFVCISNCYQFASEVGIGIDEDNGDSKVGKQCAEKVMHGACSVHFSTIKDEMLPLQGTELWYIWAECEKECHRHVNRKQVSVTEYTAQKNMQKAELRKLQLERCKTSTSLMACFMTELLQANGKKRICFLQWLKLLLDDYSRKKICQN